ncbi:hypothetical protein DFH11DRAFT_1733225 [Phellopilus nigrolimitatus]|nr:hypothetical protein DFH11DRAFT_1733225 [Phellopilus nigrolimitatus]
MFHAAATRTTTSPIDVNDDEESHAQRLRDTQAFIDVQQAGLPRLAFKFNLLAALPVLNLASLRRLMVYSRAIRRRVPRLAIVSSLVGGQAQCAVSCMHQTEAAAIIAVALFTATFALFGYRYVHLD